MTAGVLTQMSAEEIRANRLSTPRQRCGWLTVATPWAKKGENIGTLVRTCDAVGSCLALPAGDRYSRILRHGNTVGNDKVCLHRFDDPLTWLKDMRRRGRLMLAVEMSAKSTPLKDVKKIVCPTVIVLGNEAIGIPKEVWPLFHGVVEIPMLGVGSSLNVAVAGSLVAYKLVGLS